MNSFAGFVRSVIGERNEGTRRQVQALRLENRLRSNDEPNSDSRLAHIVSKSTLPLLRGAGLAGSTGAMMYQEEIVLYARSRSRSCRRARRLLKRKGYAFEEIDVGGDEGLLKSLSEVTGKEILLPLVFLGGRLVGGLGEIQALERSGDLDRLVRGRV